MQRAVRRFDLSKQRRIADPVEGDFLRPVRGDHIGDGIELRRIDQEARIDRRGIAHHA